MHDSLFGDQGRLEDPHLWNRARELGLDLERFDEDRHSEVVAARVQRDFQSGVRAGVVTTPTVFVGDAQLSGSAAQDAVERLIADSAPVAHKSCRDPRRGRR